MTKGLVTVVVPVYKVEKYLDHCVNSIVSQSYENLEIILVDDGSPDRCPEMCDRWAEKDSRIKVFHQENQGLSAARNVGIANATGQYICFVDSDDFIDVDMVRRTYELAEKEQAELVVFGMGHASEDGQVIGKDMPTPQEKTYRGCAVQEVFFPEIVSHNPETGKSFNVILSACVVLFSMELIRRADWKFASEREVLSEDVYSLLALYKDVQSVAVLEDALYFYRKNNMSISRSYRPDRFVRNREYYLKCLELCDGNGYSAEVRRRCKEPYLANVIASMKQVVAYYNDYDKAKEELQVMINDDVFQQVLLEKKHDKEGFNKKMLYWAARNKWYFLCYVLLAAKVRR